MENNIGIEEIHDYLELWVSDEIVNDYGIAHATGYTEICIYLIQSSGVIGLEADIERAISEYKVTSKKFGELCDELFQGVVIMTNPNTNETYWIPNLCDQGLDYFTSESECISWGYTEKYLWPKKQVA